MKKKIIKQDLLLKIIDYYKEISPSAINVISTDTYFKKTQTNLVKKNYISKSNLNIRKSTSKEKSSKREIKENTYKAMSYYLTPNGKKYLYDNFPNEYPNYVSPPIRKNHNGTTMNLIRKSNIEIMALSIDSYKLENDFNEIDSVAEDEDNFLEKELDTLSENFKDNGDCVADTFKNNDNFSKGNREDFSEAFLLKLNKEINENCVYIPIGEIKKRVRPISEEDLSHDSYVGLSSVILSKEKLYSMYSAIDGYLSLTRKGEAKRITQIASHLASRYGVHTTAITMADTKPNGIIICETLKDIKNLYINKYNHKTEFNEVFMQANAIPMDRNGQIMLQRVIYCPEYEKIIAKEIIEGNGYIYNSEANRFIFPIKNQKDEYVLIGFNFNIDIFSEILKKLKDKKNKDNYSNFEILCFPWQKPVYQEILTHYNLENVTIKNIKENVADDLTGFQFKEPITGEDMLELLNLGTYEKLKKKEEESIF